MVRPQGDANAYVVTKADVDSFSQTPAGLTEAHLTLSCLCCLVSAAQIKNKLSGPDLVFLPPASFAT